MDENPPRRLRRNVTIVLVILSTIIATFFYMYYILSPVPIELCRSNGCEYTRNMILDVYDPAVNPCEDFFHYLCGNVKIGFSLNHLAINQRRRFRHDLLTNGTIRPTYANSTIGAIQFYRACVDSEPKITTAFEDLFNDSQTMEAELFGRKIDWIELTLRARNKGLRYNFFLDVTTHMLMERSRWIIHLKPLSTDYAHVWQWRNKANIWILMKYWRRNITPPIEGEVVDLIYKGEQLTRPQPGSRNAWYTQIDAVAASQAGFIPNFLQFLKQISHIDTVNGRDDILVSDNILKNQTAYMTFLQKVTNTNNNFWFNYIALITMLDECFFLAEPAQTACAAILGQNKMFFCEHIVQSSMEAVVAAEYIRTTVTEEASLAAHKLAKDIQNALDDEMDNTTFSVPTAGRTIQNTIGFIFINFGGIFGVYNYEYFEHDYGTNLTILNSTNASEIYNTIRKHTVDRTFKGITLMHNPLVNYYFLFTDDFPSGLYLRHMHTIYMAPEELALPFFSLDRPHYVNVAMFGNAIAHELVHAIAQHTGDWHPFIPWNSTGDRVYQHRVGCVNDQYGNYLRSMNLTLTSPESHNIENVADIAAINVTYNIYTRLAEAESVWKPVFDEKQISIKQLFWLLRGVMYCMTDAETKALYVKVSGDPVGSHGFPQYRIVNGPLNSGDFPRDFGCKTGQRMTSFPKCPIFGV